MQVLAQAGNGNAAYIDSLMEARKVLVDEMGSTLFSIANDVKIQVEFNPAYVAEYRLIGYETRLLAREDFNNDKVDAGEVGSGHEVTALYEITPPDSKSRLVDDLRYGKTAAADGEENGEIALFRLRYKLPGEATSTLMEQPIMAEARVGFDAAPAEARFATAVAGFGQLLRGAVNVDAFSYDDVLESHRPPGARTPSATGPSSCSSYASPSRRRRWKTCTTDRETPPVPPAGSGRGRRKMGTTETQRHRDYGPGFRDSLRHFAPKSGGRRYGDKGAVEIRFLRPKAAILVYPPTPPA